MCRQTTWPEDLATTSHHTPTTSHIVTTTSHYSYFHKPLYAGTRVCAVHIVCKYTRVYSTQCTWLLPQLGPNGKALAGQFRGAFPVPGCPHPEGMSTFPSEKGDSESEFLTSSDLPVFRIRKTSVDPFELHSGVPK
jgi:hypothetical protein